MAKGMPLRCQYKQNRIVIEIGHDVLAHATNINPDFYNDELDTGQYRVVDHKAFAKEVVGYLNQEDEEGNTLVTTMLDQGITRAIEGGSEGVEDIEDDRVILVVKDAPLTEEQRHIENCCETPHDCKWGGLGGCGYAGRKYEAREGREG